MIEVTFLGVGEAFDENLSNTSILIRSSDGNSTATLLLDCGFTAPPPFWKEVLDPDELDGIWVSHFHADHTFGIPALVVRLWREGRTKPLIFIGQNGIESFFHKVLDLAYPGFLEKIQFPIKFLELEPKEKVEFKGLSLRAAENVHSQRALGLKIEADGRSIYYSGDGSPSPEAVKLANGCRLIIQESYSMDSKVAGPGHATVKESIEMAEACAAKDLALVHLQRSDRDEAMVRLEELNRKAGSVNVLLPEPGYRMRV